MQISQSDEVWLKFFLIVEFNLPENAVVFSKEFVQNPENGTMAMTRFDSIQLD